MRGVRPRLPSIMFWSYVSFCYGLFGYTCWRHEENKRLRREIPPAYFKEEVTVIKNNQLITEAGLVTATIVMEAGGEPFEGQVAVAKVIRERMRLGHFSDGSLTGTVLRPMQFSCWNGDNPSRAMICALAPGDERCETAWDAWKESEKSTILPEGTVLYHADYVKPKWALSERVKFVKQIGRHLFYKEV